MKTSGAGFCAARGAWRVVVGVFVVCVLVVSGLFWGGSGIGGKIKVDPRSPIDTGSLVGLEMRRLDLSPRFARWNSSYCGTSPYDAAWTGYVAGRSVCMIYKVRDNEFWLVKGEFFIPLTTDIILLNIRVGDTGFMYAFCDEGVLRCQDPMVMPPASGLDVAGDDNLVIETVSTEDENVEPEGVERLRERVARLPNSPWSAKLCYVTDTLRYSDNCEDENAPPVNFSIERIDLDERNIFYLTWYWDSSDRHDPVSFLSSVYLRDIGSRRPYEVSCEISESGWISVAEGYHRYKCPGPTLDFEGNFIVIGSDRAAAESGGVILSLPKPEVRVVAMEVTQGLQNWDNAITLVKNRRTAVRVFMETTLRPRKITADLRGTVLSRHGARTIGSTPPVNHNLRVEVKPNIVERRGDIEASLNFMIPSSWYSLNEGDQLKLELDFDESNIDCRSNCSVTVSFTELAGEPYLVMVPLAVMDGEQKTEISLGALHEQFDRIMSVMPLSHYFYFTLDTVPRSENDPYDGIYFGEYEPVGREVNIKYYLNILSKWAKDSSNEYIYLGVLPGGHDCDCEIAGIANMPSDKLFGRTAVWYSGYPTTKRAQLNLGGSSRNRGGHELGHLFGFQHPIRFREKKNDKGSYSGECDETSSAEEVYPYFHDIDDKWLPTLGELHNSQIEAWGIDLRFVIPVKGRRLSKYSDGDYEYTDTDFSVIDPYEVFSIMSYCPHKTNRPLNQGRWIDIYHHRKVIDLLKDGNNIFLNSSISDYSDLISGFIYFSGSGDVVDVEFDPVFFRQREVISTDEGNFVLELRDAHGNAVKTVQFDLNHYSFDDEGASGSDFSIIIQDPPAYDSFAVLKDGIEYSVVTRSLNEPTVDVSGVYSGEHFDRDEIINLFWNGNDIDGDALTYRVYYSSDAGQSYRPVMFDTDRTSASFPVRIFEGSERARLGVSVSDGTRSTFVETPIFSIAGSAPQVNIESPSSSSVYASDQVVILDATGFDFEDGLLPPSAFSWRSSIDGFLGADNFFVLRATDLSVGEHTITLEVNDSNNMATIVSIEIVITAQNTSPSTVDDDISVEINEIAQIDVLANDIDLEGDIDLESFSLKTLPEIGTAQITLSPGGYPVVSYSSSIDGTDTFTYKICDYGERCGTAKAVIDVIITDCTITGTPGDDILRGTSGDDVICGLGGNDTIDARAGNDRIYGGPGNDTIYGRSGNDVISGGSGNDLILGHNGDDTITSSLGDDIIYGGGGNDTLKGGDGDDEIYGEADNDRLEGNNGNDKIHGGRGDDIIRGDRGNDTIRGNTGNDIIYPGPGDNTILGLSSEDSVF